MADTKTDLDQIRHKLLRLHTRLFTSQHHSLLDVYRLSRSGDLIRTCSVTTRDDVPVLAVAYQRPLPDAAVVERLMGREEPAAARQIEARRHPTIELRLMSSHLVLELVLTPETWWDQQNLIGKISLEHHFQSFCNLLAGASRYYCMGFWAGAQLSDMHLRPPQFQHPSVLRQLLDTFACGKDYFRFGVWYAANDDSLPEGEDFLLQTVRDFHLLISLYDFLLWTSSNNFQAFLPGAHFA